MKTCQGSHQVKGFHRVREVPGNNGNMVFYKEKNSEGIYMYMVDFSYGSYNMVTKDFIIENKDKFENVGVSGNRIYPVKPKKETRNMIDISEREKNTDKLVKGVCQDLKYLPDTEDFNLDLDYDKTNGLYLMNFEYNLTGCLASKYHGLQVYYVSVANPFNMIDVLQGIKDSLNDLPFEEQVRISGFQGYERELGSFMKKFDKFLDKEIEKCKKYLNKHKCMSFDEYFKKHKGEIEDYYGF